jgi:hypothetical protein
LVIVRRFCIGGRSHRDSVHEYREWLAPELGH